MHKTQTETAKKPTTVIVLQLLTMAHMMLTTSSRCDHIESVRMNKFEQATAWAGVWVGAKMSKVNVSL